MPGDRTRFATARRAARIALVAFCTVPAAIGAQPHPPPREDARAALARLDSLAAVVAAEEARVRRSPGAEVAWARLARAWYQVGDHAQAARSVARARELGGREFDTRLLAGRVARSEWRFAEAVPWLQRAVRMRPDDWEAHEDLGLALYLAGRLPEAAIHWERARRAPGSGAPDRGGLLAALRAAGPDAYRVSGRGRERLPFATDAPRGALVVEARIAGRGPFRLRVDTASPEVVLGRALAETLGLAVHAGGAPAAFVGGRAVRLDHALLDSLTLGATTLHRLPVAVSDHAGLGGAEGVHGTLGFEVLRRFRFCLDFPDSALWLAPAEDGEPPPWAGEGARIHRLPVLLRGTHLLVATGRLGEGPERPFLLESGAPGIALSAPISTLAEAGLAPDTTRVLTGTTAAGPVAYHGLTIPRLCVGGACREGLAGVYGLFPARLEENPSFRLAGIVSRGFLARYRFAVDPAGGEVWLIEP